jgi:hypothetical protein
MISAELTSPSNSTTSITPGLGTAPRFTTIWPSFAAGVAAGPAVSAAPGPEAAVRGVGARRLAAGVADGIARARDWLGVIVVGGTEDSGEGGVVRPDPVGVGAGVAIGSDVGGAVGVGVRIGFAAGD